MFESIDQLEKEVKEFEKNILASSELIQNVQKLTAAVQQEQQQITVELEKVIAEINAQKQTNEEQLHDMLQAVTERNQLLCENTEMQLRRTEEEREHILKEHAAQIEEITASYLEKGAASQNAFIDRCTAVLSEKAKRYDQTMDSATSNVQTCADAVRKAQDSFLEAIQKTRVEQLFDRVEEMEKRLHQKLTLLLSATAITAILALLSIVL